MSLPDFDGQHFGPAALVVSVLTILAIAAWAVCR
jgi:hypothetical protein